MVVTTGVVIGVVVDSCFFSRLFGGFGLVSCQIGAFHIAVAVVVEKVGTVPSAVVGAQFMDEHKRREMDKMNDMFGMQYSISVENQPYPVLCTLSPDGCTTHVPDFPKITTQAATLDAALLEVKQQIQKALRQYKNPPIPTKQEQIVVPNNSVLVLVKAS